MCISVGLESFAHRSISNQVFTRPILAWGVERCSWQAASGIDCSVGGSSQSCASNAEGSGSPLSRSCCFTSNKATPPRIRFGVHRRRDRESSAVHVTSLRGVHSRAMLSQCWFEHLLHSRATSSHHLHDRQWARDALGGALSTISHTTTSAVHSSHLLYSPRILQSGSGHRNSVRPRLLRRSDLLFSDVLFKGSSW